MTVDELAECLVETGKNMNEAVPQPVEGTLLSTSRDACIGLTSHGKVTTLHELIRKWSSLAAAELVKTPDQLVVDGRKVLKEAGVVDSGAQGFV